VNQKKQKEAHKLRAEIIELRFVEDTHPGTPPFGGGPRRSPVIVARIELVDVEDRLEAEAIMPCLGALYGLELLRAPRKTWIETMAESFDAAMSKMSQDPEES
jgi:hypothetical protein